MITLKSFGSAELHGDDDHPLQAVLAQPKRLALLVHLAVATPRGYHRRDKLVGLLWPDLDETRARAALSRAVHYIRSAIGEDVLLSRGTEELGLDWSRFRSDVADFEEALDRGQLEDALAIYRGPLLPGFYVDETPEFDRWLEAERSSLETRAIHAARQLSEKELSAGHIGAATEWARQCLKLAPHDDPTVRHLMLMLEQAGDRAGAVHAYEDFAKALDRDLGVEPSTETRALHEAIRGRDVPVDARRLDPVVAPTMTPPAPTSAAPVRVARPTWLRATLATVTLAAAIALAWGASRWTSSAAPASGGARLSLALSPFTATGATSKMADSIYERLKDVLDTMPAIRVEKRRSARTVLVGQLAKVGDELLLTAQLYDSTTSDEPLVRTAVRGAVGESRRLADDLAWQLEAVASSIQTKLASMDPTLTAPRVVQASVAVEAGSEGETAYREGRFDAAVRAFRRAVDADTGNALLYLSLSQAANWGDQSTLAGWAASMALQRVATVPPLGQLHIRGWHAYLTAHPRDAERLLRMAIANSPGDFTANFTLGETVFHWGPGLGWPLTEAQRLFALADTTGIRSLATLIHLTRLAGMLGETRRVDSLATRALTMHPDASEAHELRALRAFAGTATSEQDQVLREMERATDAVAQSVATYVAVSAADNERALHVLDVFAAPGRSPAFRAAGVALRATLYAARGRADALASLANSGLLSPGRAAELRGAVGILPFIAFSRDTLESLRSALSQSRLRSGQSLYDASRDPHTFRRMMLLGLLSARLGDTRGALAYADTLEKPPFIDHMDREFRAIATTLVRATVLRAEGKAKEALEQLGEPKSSPDFVIPGLLSYPVAFERYLRAELLHSLGRDAEALRWYNTFPDPGGYDLAYLAPSLLRRSEIAARRGDLDAANAYRARALRLWSGASADFKQSPLGLP